MSHLNRKEGKKELVHAAYSSFIVCRLYIHYWPCAHANIDHLKHLKVIVKVGEWSIWESIMQLQFNLLVDKSWQPKYSAKTKLPPPPSIKSTYYIVLVQNLKILFQISPLFIIKQETVRHLNNQYTGLRDTPYVTEIAIYLILICYKSPTINKCIYASASITVGCGHFIMPSYCRLTYLKT